ncbi:MAG: hypothetical protein R3E91_00335 [Chlamydiales bacterium]
MNNIHINLDGIIKENPQLIKNDTNIIEINNENYLKYIDAKFNHNAVSIRDIDENLEQFEATRYSLKRLKTVKKIISVFKFILSLLIPLSMFYCPSWVSWGMALPILLILGVIEAKIHGNITIKEQHHQVLILARKMLENHSFKNFLLPLGVWNLPPKESVLKINSLMEHLKENDEHSLSQIDRLRFHLNLDDQPTMDFYAAQQITKSFNYDTHWTKARQKVIEAKKYLDSTNVESYKKKIVEGNQIGFFAGFVRKDPYLHQQIPSVENQVCKFVWRYNSYVTHANYAKESYCLASDLFKEELENFGESFDTRWKSYQKEDERFNTHVDEFLEILKNQKTWVDAAFFIQKHDLAVSLEKVFEKARNLNSELKKKIENHPLKLIESYHNELEQLQSRILSASDSEKVKDWIDNHPTGSVIQISDDFRQDSTIFDWIQAYQDTGETSLTKIYEQNTLRCALYQRAKEEINNINQETSFKELSAQVSQFEKNQMKPLRRQMRHYFHSFLKRFWKEIFHKEPVQYFEFTPLSSQTTEFEKFRRIQEININAALKTIHRIEFRKKIIKEVGLQWVAVIVLMIVESVFSSSLWVTLGMTISFPLIEGIGRYLDYRLKKIKTNQLNLKMQVLLKDYVDLKRIPGSCSSLQQLKNVQFKYHLENVNLTWAKSLTQENDALFIPQSLEEGKIFCRKLLNESREKATTFINKRCLALKRDLRLMQKRQETEEVKEKIREIKSQINLLEIEKLKENKIDTSTKKAEKEEEQRIASHYILRDNNVTNRIEMEKILDEAYEQKMGLQERERQLNHFRNQINRIEEKKHRLKEQKDADPKSSSEIDLFGYQQANDYLEYLSNHPRLNPKLIDSYGYLLKVQETALFLPKYQEAIQSLEKASENFADFQSVYDLKKLDPFKNMIQKLYECQHNIQQWEFSIMRIDYNAIPGFDFSTKQNDVNNLKETVSNLAHKLTESLEIILKNLKREEKISEIIIAIEQQKEAIASAKSNLALTKNVFETCQYRESVLPWDLLQNNLRYLKKNLNLARRKLAEKIFEKIDSNSHPPVSLIENYRKEMDTIKKEVKDNYDLILKEMEQGENKTFISERISMYSRKIKEVIDQEMQLVTAIEKSEKFLEI